MDLISCVFNLDGRPVKRDSQTASAGLWAKNCIRLGYYGVKGSQRSPVYDRDSSLCAVVSGSICNLEDLAESLKVKKDEITPEFILTKAYRKYGEACPEKLLGDFAFVIWNEKERSCFCARDFLGLRPFYYYLDKKRFICSSTIAETARLVNNPFSLNEGFMAEYLSTTVTSVEETHIKEIYRLPPAHFLKISCDKIKKVKYWDSTSIKPCTYKNEAEYTGRLTELIRKSVECRINSNGEVGVLLSGGIDSSVICKTLHSIIKKNGADPEKIHAFSSIYPGKECDEKNLVLKLAELLSVNARLLSSRLHPPDYYQRQVQESLNFPGFPNSNYTPEFLESAAKCSNLEVFTGMGGDELFGGSFFPYMYFLRRLEIISALKMLKKDPAVRELFSRLTPDVLKPLFGTLIGTRYKHPNWLSGQFVRKTNLAERQRTDYSRLLLLAPHQRSLYLALTEGTALFFREMDANEALLCGINIRHPFYDQRLIEFSFSLPERYLYRSGWNKYILRKAFCDSIPPGIVWRKEKADFSHLFPEALMAAEAGSVFGRLELAEAGFIEHKTILEMYDQMLSKYKQGDRSYDGFSYPLWAVFSAELLFRRVNSL